MLGSLSDTNPQKSTIIYLQNPSGVGSRLREPGVTTCNRSQFGRFRLANVKKIKLLRLVMSVLNRLYLEQILLFKRERLLGREIMRRWDFG